MEPRQYGEYTTYETRDEANKAVNRKKRYRQIIGILREYDCLEGLSAKHISNIMFLRGLIPTDERNFTAPRLTELSKLGVVEPVGKDYCPFTGKKVSLYKLRDEATDAVLKELKIL